MECCIYLPLWVMLKWKIKALDNIIINDSYVFKALPTKSDQIEIPYRYVYTFSLNVGMHLSLQILRSFHDLKRIVVHVLNPEKCEKELLKTWLKLRIEKRYVCLGQIENHFLMAYPIRIQYFSLTTSNGECYSLPENSSEALINQLSVSLSHISIEEKFDHLDTKASFPNFTFNSESDDLFVKPFYHILSTTDIVIDFDEKQPNLVKKSSELSDAVVLFGLEEALSILTKITSSLLKGTPRPSSLTLFGPAGCGKRSLITNYCQLSAFHHETIDKSLFSTKFLSNVEKDVDQYFQSIYQKLPCIVFLPNIDAQFPASEDIDSDRKLRIALSKALKSALSTKRVVLLATASDLQEIHKDIRALLYRELLVPLPSADSRFRILHRAIQEFSISENFLKTFSSSLFGYSASDLMRLIDKAYELCDDTDIDSRVLESCLLQAATDYRPSGLRGIASPVSRVNWADIGGYSEVKTLLRNCVEIPLKQPQHYRTMGLKPPSGILLYGPPGCSKTMFARALATECQLNMIAVSGASLYSRYVGDSERAMRKILLQARASAPVVLFIDEVDAILPNRSEESDGNSVGERILTELLTAMDGVEGRLDNVIVLAATNRPSKIDPALLRPGRLDKKVYIPLPDIQARREILKLSLLKRSLSPSLSQYVDGFNDVPPSSEIFYLTDKLMEGLSGAEIVQIVEEAAHLALDQFLKSDELSHTLLVLDLVHIKNVLNKANFNPMRHNMEVYENFSQSTKNS